jgi:hypothetical protein
METHQDEISVGLFFWPALAMVYGVLISGAIWLIWG